MTNKPKPPSPQCRSWRDVLPIHPAAELFPRMTPDELRALGKDIGANGLTSPIVLWRADPKGQAQLLDGRNRLDAIEIITGKPVEIGAPSLMADDFLATDKVIVLGKAVDPYTYVVSANIHRRHLTAEQKRELIAKLLKATPEKSDRQIAETVKASPTTVGTVRAGMEAKGEVSKLDTRTDAKGVKQPAHKALVKPEPKPGSKTKSGVNPACLPLFDNEDQRDAFCEAVTTKAARRFITFDQQLELAKNFVEGARKGGRRLRVPQIKAGVSFFVRAASKEQGKIDVEEKGDFYKQFPGHEIRDEVAAVGTAERALIGSLLKLEDLAKKFPGHPFFGNLGSKLDAIIGMIRQYRRAAGEKSADEIERKLTRLQELEHKARTQEITIAGLRSEIEELKARLTPPPAGDDGLDIPASLRRTAP